MRPSVHIIHIIMYMYQWCRGWVIIRPENIMHKTSPIYSKNYFGLISNKTILKSLIAHSVLGIPSICWSLLCNSTIFGRRLAASPESPLGIREAKSAVFTFVD